MVLCNSCRKGLHYV
ncbi:hypothetical protein CDG55_11035 [Acinetobacter sp. WCHA45]|nr:hypothetical protein CDG55_11035 [Acinetobacter sp. WCHA45]AZM40036.1 hypothetical protein EJP75_11405 [Acinetobacter baumannii]